MRQGGAKHAELVVQGGTLIHSQFTDSGVELFVLMELAWVRVPLYAGCFGLQTHAGCIGVSLGFFLGLSSGNVLPPFILGGNSGSRIKPGYVTTKVIRVLLGREDLILLAGLPNSCVISVPWVDRCVIG